MISLLSQSVATIEALTNLYQMFGEQTPLVFAIIPSLIAVILFFAFRKSENKMLSLLPYIVLGLGIILGIFAYILMSDSLFMSIYLQGRGKKTLLMRAVPIVPVITAIGIFFLSKRNNSNYNDQL